MFEKFFEEEIKLKQDKLKKETKQATDDYIKMRESNPSMINTMDLVNSPQNYNQFGYNNMYLNPNLIPPFSVFNNNNLNPYVYNRPLYGNTNIGGTWYGNSYYDNFYDYTSRFMLASDEEIRLGQNTRGSVTLETANDIIDIPSQHISYIDKISGNNLQVSVKEETIEEEKHSTEQIKDLYGIKYIEKKLDISKHPLHVPFTMEELRQETVRVLVSSPLIWTEDDENELNKLVDTIAIYDKALAHIMWNIPCNLNHITREEYNYCKIYCRNLIQEYRSEEILRRNIDFRAPYRYRKLPETCINENYEEVVDITKPYPYAKLCISPYSNQMVYEYDRERDELTEEEWNLFLDFAYCQLMEGIKVLQGKDLLKINEPLLGKSSPQSPEVNNSTGLNYNPYDPISIKLYNMKQSERGYNVNKEFFKYALRHKFQTDEQFDNWWYGTQSNAEFVKNQSNPDFYRNYRESSWKRQMTEQNIANLSRFVPLNHQLVAQQYNQRAQQEIEKFTKGNIQPNMSMSTVVNNLSYLDNRIHEMTVEDNFKNYKNSLVYNNGQSIINKNMFNHMLYEFHNNDNPNYVSQYGPTIDPRMGVPSVIQDYTQDSQNSYRERLQRFLNACHQMQEFPLNSAGVLK